MPEGSVNGSDDFDDSADEQSGESLLDTSVLRESVR